MKTIKELTREVAEECFADRAADKLPTFVFVADDDELLNFATKFLETWQAQSQEPVAWACWNDGIRNRTIKCAFLTGFEPTDYPNRVPLFLTPPPAKMPRFNCFAIDNGCEQWFDCPDDAEILQELDIEHVGQEFELIAGWRSGRAKYRVTKAPDETSDDFEVECISHPEENVTPPAIHDWQPIETAPKDGTRILAWELVKGARETLYSPYREGSVGRDKFLFDGGERGGWEWEEPHSSWVCFWKPTHWMKLPSPPKQGGKE